MNEMSNASNMKTPLKRVRGFGASKTGTEHFWQQRATAVANLPLMAVLVWFLIAHFGATRAEVIASLQNPIIALLLIMALASACWHMRLGLQVVIEDYLHSHLAKFAALALNIAIATSFFAIAAYSILKMSFAP
ncbi:MAG: succinate dehydrogenase, hydrophobic membrane anchor protein [Proteobacteria bacterium]|nr:succinate dehydrogenase, hydrophobic membrane anchor protein [Pseudomonadota bacterium]